LEADQDLLLARDPGQRQKMSSMAVGPAAAQAHL
jgi:hypothetical protein